VKWEKLKKDELIKKCREFEKEIKELQSKIEEGQKRIKELEDYAKRLKAQYENYRREVAEEKQRIIKNANEYLISKIIPVLDDFERAINTTDKKDAFTEGIEKIYKKLVMLDKII
jgi:molecular chaperone GrpE